MRGQKEEGICIQERIWTSPEWKKNPNKDRDKQVMYMFKAEHEHEEKTLSEDLRSCIVPVAYYFKSPRGNYLYCICSYKDMFNDLFQV